jgi:hypothetical protein
MSTLLGCDNLLLTISQSNNYDIHYLIFISISNLFEVGIKYQIRGDNSVEYSKRRNFMEFIR